jgi:hypothetical protein
MIIHVTRSVPAKVMMKIVDANLFRFRTYTYRTMAFPAVPSTLKNDNIPITANIGRSTIAASAPPSVADVTSVSGANTEVLLLLDPGVVIIASTVKTRNKHIMYVCSVKI